MTTNNGAGDNSSEKSKIRNRPESFESIMIYQIPGSEHTFPLVRPPVDSPTPASIWVTRCLHFGRDQTESAHDDKHRARSILQSNR